ncbi:hypothetical protein [Candidatus Viridilinea mediisalina]|uniref:hypothetical protein n=1 Tax=Candidatus Viridilinea mediisalina TaxID=2024553 RepID=UPI001FE96FC1|nr:hypothetical protein [Candidatus Viridilinea mediisalina]
MLAAMPTPQVMRGATHHRFYFNQQPHFLTVSDNLHATYSFDGEGRLLGAFRNGVNYRRGLRGDILMKQESL